MIVEGFNNFPSLTQCSTQRWPTKTMRIPKEKSSNWIPIKR